MATSTAAGKKRMTQSDVINYFAERTGMKRAQVKQLFEDIANLATSEVKSTGEFVLPGFGKLVRSERKAREGRNPATGETIQIPRWQGDEGLGSSPEVACSAFLSPFFSRLFLSVGEVSLGLSFVDASA